MRFSRKERSTVSKVSDREGRGGGGGAQKKREFE